MKKLVLFASIALFFSFCDSKEKVPEGVLSPEKMSEVLSDIHLADGAMKAYYIIGDSAKRIAPHLYKEVFERHQVDSAKFHESLEYYFEYPEKMEYVYNLVNEKLIKLESGIE